MKNRIEIRNVEKDLLASKVLDELVTALNSKNNDVEEISVEKITLPEEKCEISLVVYILIAVGSSVGANAIYDVIKSVCGRFAFGGKEIKYVITAEDKEYTIEIGKTNKGEISIDIIEHS